MTQVGLSQSAQSATDLVDRYTGWPQWRGPNRDGISRETNLIVEWPEDGPEIVWSRSIGIGASSIAVKGDRLFSMGNERERDIVYALDAKSGEVDWKHEYKCSCIEFNTGRVLWSPKRLRHRWDNNGRRDSGDPERRRRIGPGSTRWTLYDELARGQVLGGRNWVTPAFSNGLLYCRNNRGKIVCIDLSRKG